MTCAYHALEPPAISRTILGTTRPSAHAASLVGLLVALALLAACSSSSETMGGPVSPSRTLTPGETLPLNDTVRISIGGDYPLPAGANRIRTMCTGRVTVSFTTPSGSEMNTCESANGSANQTNTVTGASQVRFDLGPGAFADVTVN